MQHVRVARIEHDVGDAGVLADVQHLLPGLAAVGRLVEPAIAARSPQRPLGRDVHRVRVARVDQDLADVLGLSSGRRSARSCRRRCSCRRRRRSRRCAGCCSRRCRPRPRSGSSGRARRSRSSTTPRCRRPASRWCRRWWSSRRRRKRRRRSSASGRSGSTAKPTTRPEVTAGPTSRGLSAATGSGFSVFFSAGGGGVCVVERTRASRRTEGDMGNLGVKDPDERCRYITEHRAIDKRDSTPAD